jgi:tRNA pseudouridine38-40 synthase
MQTFKLTLEYDGSKFSGWQQQINARTVQGELIAAAQDLFRVDVFRGELEIQGAGRTDAGVHALGQVAHLKLRTPTRLAPEQILRELNGRLPSSIAVIALAPAPPHFHARHDALSRAYFYQISTRKTALAKRYVWWVKEPLETEPMRQAAALLAGRHDFAAFRAADPSKPGESTIVVVDSAEIGTAGSADGVWDDHLIVFRVEASHFLWKMVRRLAGTLVKVGKGDVTVEQFRALLEPGRGQPDIDIAAWAADIAAWTAPASGLFLEAVNYSENSTKRDPPSRASKPQKPK